MRWYARPSVLLACFALAAQAAGDRLLATGGAVTVEGTAGGGITPWALLAGYGTDGQAGCAAAAAGVETDDYGLRTLAGGCTLDNRLEFSAGRQELHLGGLRPLLGLPAGQTLRLRYAGLKVRIAGDAVYHRFGQLAAGVIFKESEDQALVRATGASATRGSDWYVAAGKLFVDGPLGHMAYVNATLRLTNANQGGLLGFGGDREGSRSANLELAAALFLHRDLAIGAEYRQKPDNLSFAAEDDWADLFVAWFPSKHVSVVAAWTELGSIATLPGQAGPYLSLAASF